MGSKLSLQRDFLFQKLLIVHSVPEEGRPSYTLMANYYHIDGLLTLGGKKGLSRGLILKGEVVSGDANSGA